MTDQEFQNFAADIASLDDGEIKPNSTARALAMYTLIELKQQECNVRDIYTHVDGGLCIVTSKFPKYTDIDCFNDGESLAVCDPGEGKHDIWHVNSRFHQSDYGVSLEESVKKIKEFIDET